jgi:peroxiredoxin
MGKRIFSLTLIVFLLGVLVVQAIDNKGQVTKEKSSHKEKQYLDNSELQKIYDQSIQEEDVSNIGLSIGANAPNISARTLNGNTILLSKYKGKKKVIINFWATWCPPCKSEIPALEEYYKEHQSEVEIIGISIESTKREVENFVDHFDITFPQVLDDKDEINRLYQIQPIPTTYFIDETGKIFNQHIGALSVSDLNMLMSK